MLFRRLNTLVENLGSVPSTYMVDSQPSVTPVPESDVPFWSLQAPDTHVASTFTYMKTPIRIKFKN